MTVKNITWTCHFILRIYLLGNLVVILGLMLCIKYLLIQSILQMKIFKFTFKNEQNTRLLALSNLNVERIRPLSSLYMYKQTNVLMFLVYFYNR